MFFEFYNDARAAADEESETQFMIGDYLMGAPIVEAGKSSRKVYFPGTDNWYQLEYKNHDGFAHRLPAKVFKGGMTETIQNLLPRPPLTFLRAGKMLFSTASKLRARNLDSNFTVYAALS